MHHCACNCVLGCGEDCPLLIQRSQNVGKFARKAESSCGALHAAITTYYGNPLVTSHGRQSCVRAAKQAVNMFWNYSTSPEVQPDTKQQVVKSQRTPKKIGSCSRRAIGVSHFRCFTNSQDHIHHLPVQILCSTNA
jgi:hypothetical protein